MVAAALAAAGLPVAVVNPAQVRGSDVGLRAGGADRRRRSAARGSTPRSRPEARPRATRSDAMGRARSCQVNSDQNIRTLVTARNTAKARFSHSGGMVCASFTPQGVARIEVGAISAKPIRLT